MHFFQSSIGILLDDGLQKISGIWKVGNARLQFCKGSNPELFNPKIQPRTFQPQTSQPLGWKLVVEKSSVGISCITFQIGTFK